jgi:hypothetical protein
MVMLAVSPAAAETLIAGAEYGTIWLTLDPAEANS